ncbi:PREDICTED: uncharacterized protein LOC103326570 [Prunus mume]|uniref:Uncharacterized protein LOC103326570 n=1 Tax=Prunus mume TaxID=102107 RepID=A0ABM0NMK4_PRUMU|nr:PREDICTED: uncharacterized protein LOC103326570 [Prunus mume]
MASSSKSFILLDFMFALVILISSEVSARELAEITKPAIPIRGNTYPFKGRLSTTTPRCHPYTRPCHMTPPPPTTPMPPSLGEYSHGQGHHEKPGLGVAETETGN